MFDKKVTDFNSASEPSKDWVFLAHDQLNDSFSLLQNNRPLILIENHRYFSRRPYHKQKLALVLTNQRNFALEQAQKGRRVRYLIT
ncbi:MAG TPA: cryptochrome/photolyase family protein, partial [Candidatus Melainabacteria bacterium]|nr:cryptochrome/photolyase family protein [Candidatus Melainabacteria bacterium]